MQRMKRKERGWMTGTIIAQVVDVGVAVKQPLPSILKNVVVKHLKSSIGRGVYRIRYIGALTIYNPKKLPKPILCTDIYVEPMQSLYCSSRRSLRRERARYLFYSRVRLWPSWVVVVTLHNRCLLPYPTGSRITLPLLLHAIVIKSLGVTLVSLSLQFHNSRSLSP